MIAVSPHPFAPRDPRRGLSSVCAQCGQAAGAPVHLASFAGMESADAEREAACQLALAEELSAILRTPLADVSAKAGRIERESPLFYGKGENPLLF